MAIYFPIKVYAMPHAVLLSVLELSQHMIILSFSCEISPFMSLSLACIGYLFFLTKLSMPLFSFGFQFMNLLRLYRASQWG